jgi:hypothetical protein
MAEQALGDKHGVFGIVADHAAPENQSMPPLSPVQALHPAARQSFGGQSQRIANRRTDQQAAQPESRFVSFMHNYWHSHHMVPALFKPEKLHVGIVE